MKAAFQHTTIISLFCLACIVLAAPNWHTLHSQPVQTTNTENEVKRAADAWPAAERPSVLDAGIRFACW